MNPIHPKDVPLDLYNLMTKFIELFLNHEEASKTTCKVIGDEYLYPRKLVVLSMCSVSELFSKEDLGRIIQVIGDSKDPLKIIYEGNSKNILSFILFVTDEEYGTNERLHHLSIDGIIAKMNIKSKNCTEEENGYQVS